MKKIFLLILLIILLSCEDVIEVNLGDGKSQLTVDAILTNLNEEQQIRLSLSGDYFTPESVIPISNATVKMTDNNNNNFSFTYSENGKYILNEELNFRVGDVFELEITYNNEIFTAISEIKRVPQIDSITWSRERLIFGDIDSIWVTQFWAVDLPGLGDAYWVRALRNGVVNNNPSRINIAFDGAPGRGSKADNIAFTLPLRASITPGGFAGPPNTDDFLEVGESVGVNLYGISVEFAEYLNILREQLNNGGIFATLPANLPSNIINKNQDGSKALGWFEVCNVAADSAVISWERFNNREE